MQSWAAGINSQIKINVIIKSMQSNNSKKRKQSKSQNLLDCWVVLVLSILHKAESLPLTSCFLESGYIFWRDGDHFILWPLHSDHEPLLPFTTSRILQSFFPKPTRLLRLSLVGATIDDSMIYKGFYQQLSKGFPV